MSDSYDDRASIRAGAFWWRRALRILPAYWVALTGLILFFNVNVHHPIHHDLPIGLHFTVMSKRDEQLRRLCSGETLERARTLLKQVEILCAPGSGFAISADGKTGVPAICALIATEE